MIGRLTGVVLEKSYHQVLLDVQGVGYEVDVSLPTFEALDDVGQVAVMHIHTIIREDAHTLYGFFDVHERTMFRLLIKVNGIGPKVALAILSGMEWHTLASSVQTRSLDRLVKIPGVGKKTAERLVIELQDKLPVVSISNHQTNIEQAGSCNQSIEEEAHSALVNLGYKPAVAEQAVNAVMQQADWQNKAQQTSTELIRLALRSML